MIESIAGVAGSGGAVEAALRALAAPGREDLAPPSSLPSGAIDLIRVAAEDQEHAQELAARFGVDVRQIEDAALHFVHLVMFHPDSDYFRVLGVRPDDDEETLKLHFRWLQKWLHPDRDPEGWRSVYAERVNVAWAQLRRPDRREEYRQRLAQLGSFRSVDWETPVAPLPIQPSLEFNGRAAPVISSRWARRLPAIVVGAVAVLSVALFAAHQAGESLIAKERARTGVIADSDGARRPDVEVRPGGPAETAERPSTVLAAVPAGDREGTSSDLSPATAADGAGVRGTEPETADFRVETEGVGQRRADFARSNGRSTAAAAGPSVSEVVAATPVAVTAPARSARQREVETVKLAATGEGVVPGSSVNTAAAVNPQSPVPPPAPVAASPAASPASPADLAASAGLLRVADPKPAVPGLSAGTESYSLSAPVEVVPAMLEANASGTPDASAREAPVVADAMVGRRLLNKFSEAYREGAVQQVVILFAPNARTPAGNLWDLHQQYGSMFAASSRRSLEFLDVEWRAVPNGLEGVGRYEWAMRPRGKSTTEATSGRMRVVIEFMDGRPLIALLEQRDGG